MDLDDAYANWAPLHTGCDAFPAAMAGQGEGVFVAAVAGAR